MIDHCRTSSSRSRLYLTLAFDLHSSLSVIRVLHIRVPVVVAHLGVLAVGQLHGKINEDEHFLYKLGGIIKCVRRLFRVTSMYKEIQLVVLNEYEK